MNGLTVKYVDASISIELGESFLDAALRNNIELPHSCCSGVCQTCLIKVIEGNIPEIAQLGLNENQKKQRLALACQLKPVESLSVQPASHLNKVRATVVGHDLLTASVLRLRLKAETEWFPGQYVTLWKESVCGRPYSIASLTDEGYLEFHIKIHKEGEVSQWLHDFLSLNASVFISNPLGNCFYEGSMKEKPILMIGIGTGLAPLYGVAREALKNNHLEDIHLFVSEKKEQDLYLKNELFQLAQENKNFAYFPVLRDEEKRKGRVFLYGDIVEIIKTKYPSLQGWCIFICGAPLLVRKLQRHCFMNGASMSDIHSDPFISK